MIAYLSTADLAEIVERVTGKPFDEEVNDIGLLAGAVARPRAALEDVEAYDSLPLKAAALFESLARNKPLVDGNLRAAWVAVNVFLELNHRRTTFTENEAFILVHEVAHGHISLAETAERIEARLETF